MIAGHHLKSALVAASVLAPSAYSELALAQAADPCTLSSATIAQDDAAIKGVLASYNDALNGGKTAAVLPLYTDDGVFMPPYSQSAVGEGAIAKAYDAIFRELKFQVKFTIAELVVMAPTWAYVRTNSAGTTDHHSTDKTTAEANQELFIFKKEWQMAHCPLQLLADQSTGQVSVSNKGIGRSSRALSRTP
jgi:uncharacterized protein (TIGR02246 family)